MCLQLGKCYDDIQKRKATLFTFWILSLDLFKIKLNWLWHMNTITKLDETPYLFQINILMKCFDHVCGI